MNRIARRWAALGMLLCAGCSDSTAVLPLTLTASAGSAQPNLATTADGRAVLSWVEPLGDGHQLVTATLDGAAWTRPRRIAAGENWFVNWADFPSVVPLAGDRWAAHWLVRRGDNALAYDIRIAVSGDGGATWTSGMTPHDTSHASEYGFVSLFPFGDGFGAAWLDGRNLAGSDHGAHGEGDMTLRYARFGWRGTRLEDALIDARTCDCCQTSAAVTSDGLVLAYRDRSEDEVRDIAVARYASGGWQTSTIGPDGWRIDGCPVNGPAIAADGNRVALAWFSAAGGHGQIKFASSMDGGRTFTAPIVLADNKVIGRVDVALAAHAGAHVSYMTGDPSKAAELRVQQVDASGRPQTPIRITEIPPDRSSGFPRMVTTDGRLIFAWTDGRVMTAALDLDPARRD